MFNVQPENPGKHREENQSIATPAKKDDITRCSIVRMPVRSNPGTTAESNLQGLVGRIMRRRATANLTPIRVLLHISK